MIEQVWYCPSLNKLTIIEVNYIDHSWVVAASTSSAFKFYDNNLGGEQVFYIGEL